MRADWILLCLVIMPLSGCIDGSSVKLTRDEDPVQLYVKIDGGLSRSLVVDAEPRHNPNLLYLFVMDDKAKITILDWAPKFDTEPLRGKMKIGGGEYMVYAGNSQYDSRVAGFAAIKIVTNQVENLERKSMSVAGLKVDSENGVAIYWPKSTGLADLQVQRDGAWETIWTGDLQSSRPLIHEIPDYEAGEKVRVSYR